MMTDLGFTCFIALDEAVEILPAALARGFQDVAPRSGLVVEQALDTQIAAQALSVLVDGHRLSIIVFDEPLPGAEMAEAAAASLFWRDAAGALADHQGFVAITAVEPQSSHGLTRAQAAAITRLAAVLCEGLPALGVLWLSAGTISPPEALVRAHAGFTRGYWPVNVWIGWFAHGEVGRKTSTVGFQTKGASDFLGFELYCEAFETADVKEPLRLLYATAAHLMANGDVIPDGRIVEVEGERRTQYKMLFHPDGRPGVARLQVLEREHRKMN